MDRRTAALRTLPQTRRARVRRELVRGAAAMGARRGRVVIWGLSSPRSSAEERVVSTHLAGGSNPSGGTVRPYSRHRARGGCSSRMALSPLSLPPGKMFFRCRARYAIIRWGPYHSGRRVFRESGQQDRLQVSTGSRTLLPGADCEARCEVSGIAADSAQPRHSSCPFSSCPFSSCPFSSCPFWSCPFSS